MPDAILQLINPTDASTQPIQQEQPVAWMRQCLLSARQIEQMAIQMDTALASRDAKIAQSKEDHSQRITEAGQLCRKSILDAEQVLSRRKAKAELEESRIKKIATDALSHFKIEVVPPPNTPEQTQKTTAVLEERLKSTYEMAIKNEKALEGYKQKLATNIYAVGCGGLIFLALFFALIAHLDGGNFFFLLILTAIPVALIWRTVSFRSTISRACSDMKAIVRFLIMQSSLDHRKAVTASQAIYDQSVTQAEAKLKQEDQEAAKQRDDYLNACRAACSHQCSDLMQKINSVYIDVSQDIMSLNQGLIRGGWADESWNAWEPSLAVPGCLRVGTAVPDMPRFHHHVPNTSPLAVPALVDYEAGKGVVIAAGGALTEARQMAQSAILRLLATVPPASVRFVMVDPVSLGGNVAGFMALEKYEASLVGGKAWSDARHIEQALSEVTEHMETVIQKYLREDYKSIAEYNAKARVKEAYRIVVIFDFPVNFTEGTAKRLISIMRNGPRCGVFPIIVADNTKPLPYGVSWADLTSFAMVLQPSDSPALVLADAAPVSQSASPSGASPSGQGVVDDYYDDEDEEDEDE